jgi:spore coat protein U-like protein
MKTRLFALAAALLLGCGGASAAMTCSVTQPTFTWNHNATGPTSAASSIIFSCTRGSTNDTDKVTYEAELRDNGANPTETTNRAKLGGASNYISYELYTNSACSAPWGLIKADFPTWTTTGTKTVTLLVWACTLGAQGGKPVGTYSDSVSARFKAGSLTVNSFLPVTIQVAGSCAVSLPPALNFNYTAFGPQVNSSTTFTVNCNSGMPYTMAVSTPTGPIVGLTYTLSVNSNPQNGDGTAQPQTITGMMAAGQAGSCEPLCTDSQPHTLTISY